MITLYSGTPGSGKSLHLASQILLNLKFGRNVIANFNVNEKMLSKYKGKFFCMENEFLTVERLVEFAKKMHKVGKENQTLLAIDEAQLKFNCRDYDMYDRKEWINFFLQHRKIGFSVIMVCSFDRMLDRQMRNLIEYEIKHRKVNNYGPGMFIPLKTFVAIEYWYGAKQKISSNFFIYKWWYRKFYDSYKMFDFEFGR